IRFGGSDPASKCGAKCFGIGDSQLSVELGSRDRDAIRRVAPSELESASLRQDEAVAISLRKVKAVLSGLLLEPLPVVGHRHGRAPWAPSLAWSFGVAHWVCSQSEPPPAAAPEAPDEVSVRLDGARRGLPAGLLGQLVDVGSVGCGHVEEGAPPLI